MATTAVKVAEGLPEACFAVIPERDVLIVIGRGENGYHEIDLTLARLLRQGELAEDSRDRLNWDADITPAQVAAMMAGSICGWNCRAADPANYDEDGFLKR